jgi:hypothetical protein
VHLTTLSPPALLGDLLLVLLCHKATASWDASSHTLAMQALGVWMLVSKFIKLLGHYIRFPVDFLLLPVSILFGYFHGGIKMYAVLTLNVVSRKSKLLVAALSLSVAPTTGASAAMVESLLVTPSLRQKWVLGSGLLAQALPRPRAPPLSRLLHVVCSPRPS